MFLASQPKTAFKTLLTAIALGVGAIALTAPAEARMGGMGMGGMGGFHGGFGGGFGGFHGGMGGMGGFGGFRPPIAMHPGFRPGFGNRVAFGNRPFFFDHRHAFHDNGFAVGLVSGAVLGGLAYGYPYYDTYPYYGIAYGGDCYVIHRRFVNPWGHVVIRRALVCD